MSRNSSWVNVYDDARWNVLQEVRQRTPGQRRLNENMVYPVSTRVLKECWYRSYHLGA